jgi:hypothetical protein
MNDRTNELWRSYPKMDNKNEKSQINQKRYSKTLLYALSKLAEQAEIHLTYVFKDVVYMCEKVY